VKLIFNIILMGVLIHGSGRPVFADADPKRSAERLASLVSYVAADYPGAVRDGKVIAPAELDEQAGMLSQAKALAKGLVPLPNKSDAATLLDAELTALETAFRDKRPEAELAAASRKILARLLSDYGLVLTPTGAPSLDRARTVYAAACARCHGPDGHADTPEGRNLKPPPPSFFDEERLSRVSPQLAYHALTFGITGTSMASFETLSASDRWNLAFYVTQLRRTDADAALGAKIFTKISAAGQPAVDTSAAALSSLSDVELEARLTSVGDAVERKQVVAWLRREATFIQPRESTFAEAKRLLDELGRHAGERDRARELAVAAYLEGVEPHEASLRTQDPAMCDRVEAAFASLRHLIDAGGSAAAINAETTRVKLVLEDAEQKSRIGKGVPFFAAFAIALREGFELSLLLAALLAFIRKSGRPELARYIHAGWLAAIPAGAISWFAVGAALAGARRELTEGLLTLTAAAMLLFVSHFVLGKMESKKWLKFLEKRTKTSATEATTSIPWPLVSVAFVAAYREAIENVLFFKALILDSAGGGWWVVFGAASGIAALVVLVQIMTRLGKRLNPKPVMTASSILLTVIAISLVGQGVRSLQEGGYLGITPIGLDLKVGLLGIFPSVEGLGSQVVVMLLALVPTWLDRRKQARHEVTPQT